MELVSVEQFLSHLSKDVPPSYLNYLNSLNLKKCSKEVETLITEEYNSSGEYSNLVLSILILNFSRQASLALLNNEELNREIINLKQQNSSILHELLSVNRKAMHYLEDLHAAESKLSSYREELFRLKSEWPAPPQSHVAQSLLSPDLIKPFSTSFQQGEIQKQVPANTLHADQTLVQNPIDMRTRPNQPNGFPKAVPCDKVPNLPSCAMYSTNGSSPILPVYSGEDCGSENGHQLASLSKATFRSLRELGKGGSHFDSGFSSQYSCASSDRDSVSFDQGHSDQASDSLAPPLCREAHCIPASLPVNAYPRLEGKLEDSFSRRVSKTHTTATNSQSKRVQREPLVPSQKNAFQDVNWLGRDTQSESRHHTLTESAPNYDRPSSNRQARENFDVPRYQILERIAKDVDPFDPEKLEYNLESYLQQIDSALADLPSTTEQEKVILLLKTSSSEVRGFIREQPLTIRNNYSELCKALISEYLPNFDEATAMIEAVAVKHSRTESPREYHKRLKLAFFQGRNRPGLEEDRTFRSLFLHNLHPCIRAHVVLSSAEKQSVHEIRNIAQIAWDALRISPAKTNDQMRDNPNANSSSLSASQHSTSEPKTCDQRSKKSFFPKGHRGRSSRSDASSNWREDRSNSDTDSDDASM